MKILDWINKFFRRNNIKRLEAPKNIEENDWKKSLQCQSNINAVNNLTEEQMKSEQIKSTTVVVLIQEDYLLREYIINSIEKKFGKVVLNDAEINSLIVLHDIIECEDEQGENNIREFIDDDENNIVRLVDKMVQYAKCEAEKNQAEDVLQFIPDDVEVIDSLKNQIKNELENSEKENDENEDYREGE